MAKKSKNKPRRRSDQALVFPNRQSSDTLPGSDFNPDYTYVIKDLKRIGLLVISFLMIFGILAIFLIK